MIVEEDMSFYLEVMGMHICPCIAKLMCSLIFREIKVLGRSGDTTAGELMGAFYISARGNACVSDTSVFLFDSEHNFLRVFL